MQRLDYIQGTGTQYIDTKYIPTQNTAFEITLSNVTKGEYAVFGQNNWSPNSRLLTSQTELRWYYNSSYYMVTADVTGKHTIYLKNNYVKLDGVVKNSSTSQNSNIEKNTSIKLFSCNGQYIGRYRLYSFKIYENDVLVVDLVPVRADNGEVCLVDMITKKYYSNNGTGAFTAGPILEPAFSRAEAVMLSGQTAYFKKSGLMYNHGTITLDNALAARTFSEGYVGPNSILHGTDLAITSEYKSCESLMKSYMGDHWEEKEGERTIITNSNIIKNLLTEGCNDMQILANSTVKPYTELRYIGSTGTQYIDTGITPTNHYVEFKARLSSSTANQALFGTDSTGFGVSLGENSRFKYATGTEEKIETRQHSYSHVYTFVYNKDNKFIINNEVIDDNINASNNTSNIYVYSMSDLGGNTNCKMYLYYFKIYDSTTNKLVRDFIPVKDKSGMLCFYEKITGTYYYSDGTSTFTSSTTKVVYNADLEYVETVNDSYVNGYGTASTTSMGASGFELDFMPMEDFNAVDGAEKYILCASNGTNPDTNYRIRICSYPGYPNGMIQIGVDGEKLDAKLQVGKRQKIVYKDGVLTLPDGTTHNIQQTTTSLNWRLGQSRAIATIDHARVRIYRFKLHYQLGYYITDSKPILSAANTAMLHDTVQETNTYKSGVLKPGPIKKGE